jgi:hypothetical protein
MNQADPFGIRTSVRIVIGHSPNVALSERAIRQVAHQIMRAEPVTSDWRADHLGDWNPNPAELANFVLVLDALNFCFWGEPRWRVETPDGPVNGYWALTAALRRAIAEGYPLTDARYLATIPAIDVAHILRGESIIPLFGHRVANLREAGIGLCSTFDGSFLNAIEHANGSAVALLRLIVTTFPSFVDVQPWRSRIIPFYKRAQILVSDIAGAFAGTAYGTFHDLDVLTAFADYKVPQVLHQLGVLRYSPALTERLRSQILIPEDDPMEVEIRAATIAAVEAIAAELLRLGRPLPPYAVDWFLWDLGQSDERDRLPYHRTRTVRY